MVFVFFWMPAVALAAFQREPKASEDFAAAGLLAVLEEVVVVEEKDEVFGRPGRPAAGAGGVFDSLLAVATEMEV